VLNSKLLNVFKHLLVLARCVVVPFYIVNVTTTHKLTYSECVRKLPSWKTKTKTKEAILMVEMPPSMMTHV